MRFWQPLLSRSKVGVAEAVPEMYKSALWAPQGNLI